MMGWFMDNQEGAAGCMERVRLEHGWLIRKWIANGSSTELCMEIIFVPDLGSPAASWPREVSAI